jgi:hypothetical protein
MLTAAYVQGRASILLACSDEVHQYSCSRDETRVCVRCSGCREALRQGNSSSGSLTWTCCERSKQLGRAHKVTTGICKRKTWAIGWWWIRALIGQWQSPPLFQNTTLCRMRLDRSTWFSVQAMLWRGTSTVLRPKNSNLLVDGLVLLSPSPPLALIAGTFQGTIAFSRCWTLIRMLCYRNLLRGTVRYLRRPLSRTMTVAGLSGAHDIIRDGWDQHAYMSMYCMHTSGAPYRQVGRGGARRRLTIVPERAWLVCRTLQDAESTISRRLQESGRRNVAVSKHPPPLLVLPFEFAHGKPVRSSAVLLEAVILRRRAPRRTCSTRILWIRAKVGWAKHQELSNHDSH